MVVEDIQTDMTVAVDLLTANRTPSQKCNMEFWARVNMQKSQPSRYMPIWIGVSCFFFIMGLALGTPTFVLPCRSLSDDLSMINSLGCAANVLCVTYVRMDGYVIADKENLRGF